MTEANYNLFVPITRSFEAPNGDLYTYGVLPFDEPDSFNTVLTRELVDSNMERLRKYPAMRFMHTSPLGTIVFDQSVKDPSGKLLQTEVRYDGFAVLGKVDPACTKERSLIQNGRFGYSYGYLPKGTQPLRQCKDGVKRTHFVSGDLYEISVVDTPSNWTAETKAFVRMIQPSLSIEDIAQIKEMLVSMENRIQAKLAENSRPTLAKSISEKFRENRERGIF
jgi:hypothetical protein